MYMHVLEDKNTACNNSVIIKYSVSCVSITLHGQSTSHLVIVIVVGVLVYFV